MSTLFRIVLDEVTLFLLLGKKVKAASSLVAYTAGPYKGICNI